MNSEIQQAHGKNEGIDPSHSYQPPDGMVVLDTSNVDEDFDWDSLKGDENKELWVVRLPVGLKAKHLDGLEIRQPINAQGTKLTSVERKRAKYDFWSVECSGSTDASYTDKDERAPGGEELKHLSCLLPRKKKKGKLYIAPKCISQHIVVTHAPATLAVDSVVTITPSTRHSVPKHLLKHRFLPYGASSPAGNVHRPVDPMDVDAPDDTVNARDRGIGGAPVSAEQERTPRKKHSQSPEKAAKKRKKIAVGESETPNHKSKKLKT